MKAASSTMLITCALAFALSGCVDVPLGDPEKSKTEKKYVGLWLMKSGNETQLFDVQAFDSRAYVVHWFILDTKDEDNSRSMLFKAWATKLKGGTFLTMQSLPVDPTSRKPVKGNVMTFGKIDVSGDGMTIQIFSSSLVNGKMTPKQLATTIEKHHANAKLYSGSLELKKVGRNDKTARKILKLFRRK